MLLIALAKAVGRKTAWQLLLQCTVKRAVPSSASKNSRTSLIVALEPAAIKHDEGSLSRFSL
jgi:hypothetical protein